MTTAVSLPAPAADLAHLRAAYLALLPTVERVTRSFFRHVRCPDRKAEYLAEAVALGWKWHLMMAARGNDPTDFPVVFAYTLARAVHSGRRLCGHEKARDVLSPVCRARHGLAVAPLPDGSNMVGSVFDDALRDNHLTPVPDQVQFRVDFPRWRRTLAARDRRMLDRMAAGERTSDLAVGFRVSPARVSQLRRRFRDGWLAFVGDGPSA